jgi:hypothetical protein
MHTGISGASEIFLSYATYSMVGRFKRLSGRELGRIIARIQSGKGPKYPASKCLPTQIVTKRCTNAPLYRRNCRDTIRQFLKTPHLTSTGYNPPFRESQRHIENFFDLQKGAYHACSPQRLDEFLFVRIYVCCCPCSIRSWFGNDVAVIAWPVGFTES